MAAAETRRRRGRPPRLTPEVVNELVARVAAGERLADAARAAGISPRTLRAWRRRAWSRAPADAAYVRLERAVHGAQMAAAGRRESQAPADSWQAAAEWLEHEHPSRWGRTESLDDPLAGLFDDLLENS